MSDAGHGELRGEPVTPVQAELMRAGLLGGKPEESRIVHGECVGTGKFVSLRGSRFIVPVSDPLPALGAEDTARYHELRGKKATMATGGISEAYLRLTAVELYDWINLTPPLPPFDDRAPGLVADHAAAWRDMFYDPEAGEWRDEQSEAVFESMLNRGSVRELYEKALQRIGADEPADQDTQQIEIDVDTLELIYGLERVQDGYMTLCRKINNGWQSLAGIRAAELREHLPGLLEFLLADAYFSVNASYRAHPWREGVAGYPAGNRAEKYLRYLNANYVDLDCYKSGMTYADALDVVTRAQEANLIPPASIIGRSGRGLYLLWLLEADRPGAQQRARPAEIQLYKQTNRAIVRTLNKYEPRLYADIQAVDAARVLRVPGSINTKADEPVLFIVQATQRGLAPTYTLRELAAWYEISAVPQIPEAAGRRSTAYPREIANRGSKPKRLVGKLAVSQHRLDDVLAIVQARGGFEKGKRWKSLVHVASFAKGAGLALSDVEKLVQALAVQCRPPYPSESNDEPVREIVKAVWVGHERLFRNDTLAEFFGVDESVANELGLRSIIPAEVKVKRDALPAPRERDRQARRAFIRRVMKEQPVYPSIRMFKAMLEAEGLSASTRTIFRDVKAVRAEIASE